MAQHRLEVGARREAAFLQAPRRIDVGIREHRDAGGHVGEADRPPQPPQVRLVEARERRDRGDVVGRRDRATRGGRASATGASLRTLARAMSSSDAPASSRKRRRSDRTLPLCCVALRGATGARGRRAYELRHQPEGGGFEPGDAARDE